MITGTMTEHLDTNALDHLRKLLARLPNDIAVHAFGSHRGRLKPQWRIRPRILEGELLMLVLDGRATYTINGEPHIVQRGSFLWMTQGMPNNCVQEPELGFSMNVLRYRLQEQRGEFSPTPTAALVDVRNVDYMSRIFHDASRWFKAGQNRTQPEYTAAAHAAIQTILAILLQELEDRTAGGVDMRIERVRRYLDENPEARPNIPELAAMAELSERYFARRFAESVGQSPKKYAIATRIRHARYLLEDSGLNVQECAACLGYPDAFTFSRQFRQIIGRPPSQFTR